MPHAVSAPTGSYPWLFGSTLHQQDSTYTLPRSPEAASVSPVRTSTQHGHLLLKQAPRYWKQPAFRWRRNRNHSLLVLSATQMPLATETKKAFRHLPCDSTPFLPAHLKPFSQNPKPSYYWLLPASYLLQSTTLLPCPLVPRCLSFPCQWTHPDTHSQNTPSSSWQHSSPAKSLDIVEVSRDHPRHTVSSGNLTCRQPTHTPTRSTSSAHKHSSALVHAAK